MEDVGRLDPEFRRDPEPAAPRRHRRGESSVRTARQSGSGLSEQLRLGAVLRIQLPDSSLASPRIAGFLCIKTGEQRKSYGKNVGFRGGWSILSKRSQLSKMRITQISI